MAKTLLMLCLAFTILVDGFHFTVCLFGVFTVPVDSAKQHACSIAYKQHWFWAHKHKLNQHKTKRTPKKDTIRRAKNLYTGWLTG